MALLQNDRYLKISTVSIDYITNSASISLRVYPSQEERQREKEIIQGVTKFFSSSQKAIQSLEAQVKETQDRAGLTSENATDVFAKNPKLKSLIDRLYAIYKEFKFLSNALSKTTINKSNLKFKDFWEKVGLTDELCNAKLPECYNISMGAKVPDSTDLSSAYNAIKSNLPNSLDC